MPLLARRDPGDPLGQGDILRGLPLYQTLEDGNPGLAHQDAYVLVLSRNCNAVRDVGIIVAPVLRTGIQFSTSDKEDFDKLLQELVVHRTGGRSPDRLYLGPIDEEESQRYAAHLDEVYVLQVPRDGDARREFVSSKRVATLSQDQLYDLHARLFLCFARRGFSDTGWLPDQDLDLLVTKGTAQLAAANAATADARAKLALSKTEANTQGHEKKLKNLANDVEAQEKRAEALEERLKPLASEAAKRKLKAPSED